MRPIVSFCCCCWALNCSCHCSSDTAHPCPCPLSGSSQWVPHFTHPGPKLATMFWSFRPTGIASIVLASSIIPRAVRFTIDNRRSAIASTLRSSTPKIPVIAQRCLCWDLARTMLRSTPRLIRLFKSRSGRSAGIVNLSDVVGNRGQGLGSALQRFGLRHRGLNFAHSKQKVHVLHVV